MKLKRFRSQTRRFVRTFWGDRLPGYFVMKYEGFRQTRRLLEASKDADFRLSWWKLKDGKLYFVFVSKDVYMKNHLKEAKKLYKKFSKITKVKLVGKYESN